MINDISYKTSWKSLRIRFDKIDEIIRIYDGTRYLTLFSTRKNGAIYDRIRYLISLKSSITYIFSHYFTKFKVDSYDSLPYTLHDLIISTIRYNYYKAFLEKCSYQLAEK